MTFVIDKQLADTIVKWHKKAMPHATLTTQLEKLEEEMKEAGEATGKYIKRDKADNMIKAAEEVADVVICCVVLAERFKSLIGIAIGSSFYPEPGNPVRLLLDTQIVHKMVINQTREWEEVKPGYYRHKKDDRK